MQHITLTGEQANLLRGASGSVEVRDPEGRVNGLVKPLDPALAAVILECKHRLASPGPRISSKTVTEILRKFAEIDSTEGMTREKMVELLGRVLAGESV